MKRYAQGKKGILTLVTLIMVLLSLPLEAGASEQDNNSTNDTHAYEMTVLDMQKVIEKMSKRELTRTQELLELKGVQSPEDELMLTMIGTELTDTEAENNRAKVFMIVLCVVGLGVVFLDSLFG